MRKLIGPGVGIPLLAATLVFSACTSREPVAAPLPAPSVGSVEVRPGDQIALQIFTEPEMSGTFTVNAAGEVNLPRIGGMAVAGKPIPVVEEELRAAFGEYLRDPSMNLTVLRRVAVHGEVRSPSLYLVDMTVTLRDIIAQAGGVTPQGDPGNVWLVRDEERYRLPASEVVFLGAELHSGDQIVVGRRNWFERNSTTLAATLPSFVLTLITLTDWIKR